MRPEAIRQGGLSLLEFVLGLTILAIVLVGSTLFFAAQPRQLDPVFQYRAVSLAEALAEQVLAVKYDTNNDPARQERCGITEGAEDCGETPSASAITAPELGNFKSVDDFQLWCNNGHHGALGAIDGELLADQLDLPATRLYRRFKVETCVDPEEDDNGQPFKKVTIDVDIDQGGTLSFVLHRYNIR
ncbi:type IV pilus modification PilV family protein [Zobellella iuensis]|uniref:Prepilin-type cleavage/methylation-like protein n=1 Tax=Zobellella iuensis TaxID=2803811 RepID=A0ABS1QRP2_9GAMM|nr:prepilin-type cleavage/methylation-like protein [Zobellella iuensis]MBL1377207.1 prepilin-type cleavage/methylation-like protein [Zobellella iuensis]